MTTRRPLARNTSAKEYLPPIIKAHGHLVDAETLKTLRQTVSD
jgi:hypothetical protein